MSQARKLKVLEEENGRLKRLLAGAMLNTAVLKEVAAKLVKPAAQRKAVEHARQLFGISERRAEQPKVPAVRSIVGMAAEGCAIFGVDRGPPSPL